MQHWLIFGVALVTLLASDLGLFHRHSRAISLRQAVGWSLFWISLGLGFNVVVYFLRGPQSGLEYTTAYIVEKSLSVDNLFVICLIFGYFHVEARHQYIVLFWGIIGAILLRAVVIAAGVEVLHYLHWMSYVFGAVLIWSGYKMLREDDDDPDFNPDKNLFVRVARKFFPITPDYRGNRFFVRENGVLHATPLLVVLLVVESADLLFAVDSIPAVLAITQDYFTVLTSNVFAILGLRALYFILAGILDKFHYLRMGVCIILIFVGGKMLLDHTDFAISTTVTLTVIVSVLATAALCSVWRNRSCPPPQE